MSVKQHVKNHLWIIPAPLAQACAFAALLAWPQLAAAHGGVVAEEDTCLLQMGFLQAHFTLHQPESRGSEEFCEDLPDIGSSLFVVEYLHDMMKEMPIDFRIIRDEQGFGIFANWEDVASVADLEAQTVLHRVLARQAHQSSCRRATPKMNQIDEFRQNARTWLHDKSLSPAAPRTSNSTSSPSACWGCRIEVA